MRNDSETSLVAVPGGFFVGRRILEVREGRRRRRGRRTRQVLTIVRRR